jgi:hypothetical protein
LNASSKRAPDQKKDATTDILEKEFRPNPASLALASLALASLASGQANTEQRK